jgi:hypothetical protein
VIIRSSQSSGEVEGRWVIQRSPLSRAEDEEEEEEEDSPALSERDRESGEHPHGVGG